jgi:hypothetical protein
VVVIKMIKDIQHRPFSFRRRDKRDEAKRCHENGTMK